MSPLIRICLLILVIGLAGPALAENIESYVQSETKQDSGPVRSLALLYARDLFGDSVENMDAVKERAIQEMVGEIRKQLNATDHPHLQALSEDAARTMQSKVRQFIRNHSTPTHKRLNLMEAEARAKMIVPRPIAVVPAPVDPNLAEEDREKERRKSDVGYPSIEYETPTQKWDKEVRSLTLKLEGEPDPLTRTLKPNPVDRSFKEFLIESRADLLNRHALALLRGMKAENIERENAHYVLFPVEAGPGKESIDVPEGDLSRLSPAMEGNHARVSPIHVRLGGDSRVFTLVKQVKGKAPEEVRVYSGGLWSPVERDLIFTDPEKATRIAAIRSELAANYHTLTDVLAVMEQSHLQYTPLRAQNELLKVSRASTVSEQQLRASVFYQSVKRNPDLWARRYRTIQSLGPIRPMVVAGLIAARRSPELVRWTGTKAAQGFGAAIRSAKLPFQVVRSLAVLASEFPREARALFQRLRTRPEMNAVNFGDQAQAENHQRSLWKRWLDLFSPRRRGTSGGKSPVRRYLAPTAVGLALGAALIGGDHYTDHLVSDALRSVFSRASSQDVSPSETEPLRSRVGHGLKEAFPYLAAAIAIGILQYPVRKALRGLTEPTIPFRYDADRGFFQPHSLEVPSISDLQEHSFAKVEIPNEVSPRTMGRVTATAPVQAQSGGIVPVLRPLGQSLKAISVFDTEGRTLVQGQHFDILYVQSRDTYFIRINRNLTINAVSYVAGVNPEPDTDHYISDQQSGKLKLPGESPREQLISHFSEHDLHQLERALAPKGKASGGFTTGELARLINPVNTYPFGSETGLSDLPVRELSAYQPFFEKGCLSGMCTVGNGFGAAALNTIFEVSAPELRAEVRTMIDIDKAGAAGSVGHVTTFVYEGDKLVDRVDFTPEGSVPWWDPSSVKKWFARFEKDQSKGKSTSTDSFRTTEEAFFDWVSSQGKLLMSQVGPDLDYLETLAKEKAFSDQKDPSIRILVLTQLLRDVMNEAKTEESLKERVERSLGLENLPSTRAHLAIGIMDAIERQATMILNLYQNRRGRFTGARAPYEPLPLEGHGKTRQLVTPLRDIAGGVQGTTQQLRESLSRCEGALGFLTKP